MKHISECYESCGEHLTSTHVGPLGREGELGFDFIKQFSINTNNPRHHRRHHRYRRPTYEATPPLPPPTPWHSYLRESRTRLRLYL